MDSQFAEADKNGNQDLMVSSKKESTGKSMNYWLNVFQKSAAPREVEQRLDCFWRKSANIFALDAINM